MVRSRITQVRLGRVERRDHRAVALVVVGHRAGPPRFHRQAGVGPVQRLALRLLIEAEHRRPYRRVQVQPNNIDELVLEPGIVADLERLDPPRPEVVTGPDPRHRVLADTHPGGETARRPVRRAVRGQLRTGQPQHLPDRPGRQPGPASPPLGDHPDPGRAFPGEPFPPPPHRVRVHPTATGYLLVGHTFASPQQRPRPNHLPVRQTVEAAIRANSARCDSDITNAAAVTIGTTQPTALPHRRTTSWVTTGTNVSGRPWTPVGSPVHRHRRTVPAGAADSLALLAERLDRFLVGQLVDGVDIPSDQVHVGLKELGQPAWVVSLDQQEAGPAAGQVVPPADLLGALRAGVVLLDHSATHLLCAGTREPLEPAVPQHVAHLVLRLALGLQMGAPTGIPLSYPDE